MNPSQLLDHFDRISDAPDAIPRLRRFVLDLAVRGRLVGQDPSDETASELLKRIQAGKSLLLKAGKLRKHQEPSQVAVTERPFDVPDKWIWVRLDEIAEFSAGRTPSRSESSFWNTGGYHWVSIADMRDGGVVVATKETVSEKAKSLLFRSEPLPIGTLIMSFKLTIGKMSRLGVPAFHNEAIISIHPYLPSMNTYLFKVLPQCARQGDTKDAIKGATLNRDSLSNLLLPLPPLAEQHRIVAKVDELMALCDRLEAAKVERERRRDRLTAASLQRLNAPDGTSAFREHADFHLRHLARMTARPDQIQALREAILNLAVRGQLVPQNPSDEPAAALLDRVYIEKRRLLKVGSIPKQERVVRAKKGSTVDCPAQWETANFGDLCNFVTSGSRGWANTTQAVGLSSFVRRTFGLASFVSMISPTSIHRGRQKVSERRLRRVTS